MLWWDVEHVRAVYFDGQGVVGQDQRTVCPEESRRSELRVVTDTGTDFCHMDVVVQARQDYPQPVQDYPPIIGDVWYSNINDPDTTIMDLTVSAYVSDDFGVRDVYGDEPGEWTFVVGIEFPYQGSTAEDSAYIASNFSGEMKGEYWEHERTPH